jgi:DNA recombination protein RmuC
MGTTGVLLLVAGVIVGFCAAVLMGRGRLATLTAERDAAAAQAAGLAGERDVLAARVSTADVEVARLTTTLEHERQAGEQRLADLKRAQEELSQRFKVLTQEALDRTTERLTALTEEKLRTAEKDTAAQLEQRKTAVENLVKPIEEHLKKVATQIDQSELRRTEAFTTLGEQLRTMGETGSLLRQETEQLKNALRRPEVRGAWGELQLKRVVELAGMLEHCDFVTQETVTGVDGPQRPDLVVRLAGKRNLVVDSKVSLGAYFEALNATDEQVRAERLAAHARHVRTHVDQLAAKAYWERLAPTPELVIAFIPGEAMLAQALETDTTLIEYASGKRVMLASPTTLILMLRTAAYAWTESQFADDARKVLDEGRELYRRLGTMGDHLDKLGRTLTGSVKAYNQAVGSLERTVLPSARRMADLKVSAEPLGAPGPVDEPVRPLSAPELVAAAEEGRPVRALVVGPVAGGESDEIEDDPRYGVLGAADDAEPTRHRDAFGA